MQPLSPETRKNIYIRNKHKGARDQKRGTNRVCSDGACAVGPRRYYHVKPKANNSSEKKRKVGIRVSPNRRKRMRFRRQKKDVDPPHFRDSSFARSLQNKLNNSHNNKGFGPFPRYRRDSSFARSLQNKLDDESLARRLQIKHDLSAAKILNGLINRI